MITLEIYVLTDCEDKPVLGESVNLPLVRGRVDCYTMNEPRRYTSTRVNLRLEIGG